MMSNDYSENILVEQNAIALFAELGWETVDAFHEVFGARGTLGRDNRGEVVLVGRLRMALESLNPSATAEAIESAIEELCRERSALSPANANREVWELLHDGVKVSIRDRRGSDEVVTIRVIDWDAPESNDFLLASQLWVSGEIYTRRPDLVGFVNGLPLVIVELKATDVPVRDAFDHNLTDYKDTIPHLFWYNALLIVSNGLRSRVGSITSTWEHFAEWKQVESEDEPKSTGFATLLRGTCTPARLLEIVESFTLFSERDGRLVKLIAKNHQLLGVNNAFHGVQRLGENRGRLGVFWHTQGSGKSYSMIFFSQKVQRKLPGNWTFVIVTDRQELDEQIYRNFASVGAVTEPEDAIHATSGEHLRRLLRENHRTVFTLIQKFHTPPGELHPVLSERDDIIVITDEAHRSQYDIFAGNMRRALPNAAFIGFTGTPLMAGEERTREVFGDYVSIYNFRDSVEDGATVPLYYENRIPELQLVNEHFSDEMSDIIERADLDDDEHERLEREFRHEYHLITRDGRLDTIAGDIVQHFLGRGQQGKAMVISMDKMTAVRMYDKVREHWQRALDDLRTTAIAFTEAERVVLDGRIRYMEETDMAVVVSPGQNEVDTFRNRGLDILPHRKRMQNDDLAQRFKDPDDPFRIVFVCAMWMTGFDAPSLSTIYLDKPMRNHTLMQTIARANRVFPGKLNGLIVDYIGVFRDLQRALAIYGTAAGGGVNPGDSPVQDKSELVERLRDDIQRVLAFAEQHGVSIRAIANAPPSERLDLLSDGVERLLVSDETRREYVALARGVRLRFQAILPDQDADEFRGIVAAIAKLAGTMQAEIGQPDLSGLLSEIGELLDQSIAAGGYVIKESPEGYDTALVDLTRIDFDALQELFASGRRNTAAQSLRAGLERRIAKLVAQNRMRMDYLEQLQRMIDDYNTGSRNVQLFFEELTKLSHALDAEEQRHIREGLSEEELAVFDLLTRPNPGLSHSEEDQVRKLSRSLLETLKHEKLVLDWRKRLQSRAAVRETIERQLDEDLPQIYSKSDFDERCDAVYQHIFDHYLDAKSWTGAALPQVA